MARFKVRRPAVVTREVTADTVVFTQGWVVFLNEDPQPAENRPKELLVYALRAEEGTEVEREDPVEDPQ